jgi:hypothetical protein
MLEKTTPGHGGEIQLTDALLALSNKRGMYAYEFVGKRYDAGDKLGYLKAIVDFALSHNALGKPFREYLETVSCTASPAAARPRSTSGCAHCLDQGQTALVLVPEIALASQLEAHFYSRFGECWPCCTAAWRRRAVRPVAARAPRRGHGWCSGRVRRCSRRWKIWD